MSAPRPTLLRAALTFAALLLVTGPLPAAAQGLLGQGGLGGLLGGAKGPYTNVSGPLCEKLPATAKALLRTVPAAPSDALCSALLDNKLVSTCELGALTEWLLSSTADKPLGCNDALKLTDLPGSPEPFADLRPLPPGAFSNASGLFESEGATYFWLYRLVNNLEAHLGCWLERREAFQPPAGWELVAMLNITQAASPATSNASSAADDGSVAVPFAAVLLNRGSGQLVLAIRGTMTGAEWAVDFSYNQTADVPQLGGAPVHYGFATLFQQLWPGVQAALDELVVPPSAPATQVFVVGHSLGAAVGTLVSYAAQAHLDSAMGPGRAPALSALLVAPPNAGSPEFVESFNELVNARRLAMEYDIVPQAFCVPEMPSCAPGRQPGALGGLLEAAGVQVIPTNQPNDTAAWPYAQVGGSLVIPAEGMPQDAASWPVLQNIQLCWAVQFLFATHVCSYSCYTSQFAGPAAEDHSFCWLSAKPEGAAGSACPYWPSDYP